MVINRSRKCVYSLAKILIFKDLIRLGEYVMAEELKNKFTRLLTLSTFLFIVVLTIFYLLLFISPFLIFYGVLIFGPVFVVLGKFLENRRKVGKRMLYCTYCGFKFDRDISFCPRCFKEYDLVILRQLYSRNP